MNRMQELIRCLCGKPAPVENDNGIMLLEDIHDVCSQLEGVRSRFDNASDGDLVDACIYELESLNARYRFLIRQAREMGLTCTPAQAALLRLGGQA